MVWKKRATVEQLNLLPEHMTQHLGIEFTEVGDDFLKARMPVDQRTKQPYGVLHGGATCTLAETVGSVAANLCVGSQQKAVGVEINASHLRPIAEGYVEATCRPVRIGRSLQVWVIDVVADDARLIATCRLTVAVVNESAAS